MTDQPQTSADSSSDPPPSVRELLLDRLNGSDPTPETRFLLRELLPDEPVQSRERRAGPAQLRPITAAG